VGLDLSTDIAAVDAALRRVAAVRASLDDVGVQAVALTQATQWQSAAAQAFRDAVEDWVRAVGRTQRPLDTLHDDLVQTRHRLERTWTPQP